MCNTLPAYRIASDTVNSAAQKTMAPVASPTSSHHLPAKFPPHRIRSSIARYPRSMNSMTTCSRIGISPTHKATTLKARYPMTARVTNGEIRIPTGVQEPKTNREQGIDHPTASVAEANSPAILRGRKRESKTATSADTASNPPSAT